MAPVTSTVPDAKAALLTLLQEADGLAGVGVHWVCPPINEQTYESVFFEWSLQDASETDRALGNATRTEEYVLPVVARVFGAGDTSGQETETRAYALATEVESVVRDNHNLGLVNVQDAVVVGMPSELAWWENGNVGGIVAEVTVRVRVRARKHK